MPRWEISAVWIRRALDFDESTTVLVGANNSGKTSLLIVLRNFLSESTGFRAFDISLKHWATLRQLGEAWEAIDDDPTTDTKDADAWERQYQQLLACMPFVDLWFDARDGAYHYVAPFITTLMWSGGAVGIRLCLEPVSDANDLRKLAWSYREARTPVRKMGEEGPRMADRFARLLASAPGRPAPHPSVSTGPG